WKRPEVTIVCVLGSGRSGTSAVAHLVRELGVYWGPDEHLRLETEWNTDGCWEHIDLMNLNQHVFRQFGGTDVKPPVFPPGWERDPSLQPIRDEIKKVIERDFAGRRCWGWKDPTSCLTLPF